MKNWYKSKSVWSGILKIIAGVVLSVSQLLGGDIDVQTFLAGLASAAWGASDIVIRFKTSESIK